MLRAVILPALRDSRRDTAWLAAWSVVEALPGLVFGRAVAGAIDAWRGGGGAPVAFGWLGALLAASAAGAIASRQAFTRLAGLVEPLRDHLVRRVVTDAVQRAVQGSLAPDTGAVARITHQAEIVRDTFAGVVNTVRTSALAAGGALIGLVTLTPAVAELVAAPLVASLALLACLMRALAARQLAYVATEEAVAATAGTAAAGLRDVIACGAEERVCAEVGDQIRAQTRAARALARIGVYRTLVLAVGCWLPVLTVLAAAPWLMRHGATAGRIIGSLAYICGGLQMALRTLVQGTGSSSIRMAVTLERMLGHSAGPAPGPAPSAAVPTPPAVAPAGNDLRLCGVTFAYGERAEPVIADLDLDIPEGDHLAVVGPSGIGKSTLAALIGGMLRPVRGHILLGAVPLDRLGAAALARARVLIPQEAYVFSGTLGENLAYLDPAAATADLDYAVAAVGASALAGRLGGYSAVLDPAALSDGERQLIALARAYLAPARITILDEATCHLDPAAEARAERAFAQRPGTLVVIAHRATSALRARRVLVLDGLHAQVGDHATLLGTSALYADLIGHWDAAGGAPAGHVPVPQVAAGPLPSAERV
jgi:ATP-binding cassette subfamily C protein